jgi:hypothetical protein
MIEFFLTFGLGAGCATAVCWWFWKSSADERSRLKAQVDNLKSQVKDKMS